MKNDLIGSSVLPISNFILRHKLVKDKKPEYERYDNGFYLAAINMEDFLRTHTGDKELLHEYVIIKELSLIKKEIDLNKLDIEINEEEYLLHKNYRSKIKNEIFEKKINQLYFL